MSGLQTLAQEKRGVISDFDPTGIGMISSAVAGITKSISDSVVGVAQAKNATKQHHDDDLAAIAMSKDSRTAQLSNTTQNLIAANAAKEMAAQKTRLAVIVMAVLVFAVFAFIAQKD